MTRQSSPKNCEIDIFENRHLHGCSPRRLVWAEQKKQQQSFRPSFHFKRAFISMEAYIYVLLDDIRTRLKIAKCASRASVPDFICHENRLTLWETDLDIVVTASWSALNFWSFRLHYSPNWRWVQSVIYFSQIIGNVSSARDKRIWKYSAWHFTISYFNVCQI